MNNTMSESLTNLRNELTTWYMGLDERTLFYFESAYTQNRRAIANGLGGWTVTDEELSSSSTLAALLGVDADGEAADVVPHVAAASAPVTEPASAQENQTFKVQWVDINYGTATSGYEDVVQMFDGSNTAVFQGRVEPGALDEGAQTPVEIDVPALQAGTYRVEIVHNAGGTDPQYAQYAYKTVGLRSITESELTVSAAAN
jgi:hypothetical protein